MNHYMEKLITHLSQRHSAGTKLTGGDLLELLWYCYLEERKLDPQEIREGFQEVDSLLAQLPLRSADRIFDIVCAQCCRYQRQAFLDGLMLGAGLHGAMTAQQ